MKDTRPPAFGHERPPIRSTDFRAISLYLPTGRTDWSFDPSTSRSTRAAERRRLFPKPRARATPSKIEKLRQTLQAAGLDADTITTLLADLQKSA